MTVREISTTIQAVRRLAVTKQHLAGNLSQKATGKNILSMVRDLAYVQWDPISVIAPSHIISLWSRLGNFRLSDLDRLLWEEKKLFQHWTPIASIVLTEDYPLYYSLMRRYPESLLNSWRSHMVRAKRFLAEHAELRKRVLNELKKGPRQLSQFETPHKTGRSADGWTSGNVVSHDLPPLDERRGNGRRPSGLPEHLGPSRGVPPELGREEAANRGRSRARSCTESKSEPSAPLPLLRSTTTLFAAAIRT